MPYSTTTFSESQIIVEVVDMSEFTLHSHKWVKTATIHTGAIKPDKTSLRESASDDKEVEPFLFWNP